MHVRTYAHRTVVYLFSCVEGRHGEEREKGKVTIPPYKSMWTDPLASRVVVRSVVYHGGVTTEASVSFCLLSTMSLCVWNCPEREKLTLRPLYAYAAAQQPGWVRG